MKPKQSFKESLNVKIILFIVTTFFFTIVLAIIQELLFIDYEYIALPQLGPGLAAITLCLILYKKTLSQAIFIKNFPALTFLLNLVLPFFIISFSFIILSIFTNYAFEIESLDARYLYLIIPGMILGAFGEALGWRSFLQSSTHKAFGQLKSAILVGLIWGLWHIGHFSNGFFFMLLFLTFTICFSYVISIINARYNFNLFLAFAFHISANLGFYVFFRSSVNDPQMMLTNAILWMFAAMSAIILTKKNRMNKYEM